MKLIILDRDGVINHDSKEFIKSPDEWIPIRGSIEAIAKLSQAGYDVVILTNQSGIGRNLFSADTLSLIHLKMTELVHQHGGKISSILICPHHPDDECECRKPKVGLYTDLADRLGLTYSGVYSVGDSMRDIEAARAAGATPILVKTGNGKQTHKAMSKNNALLPEPQIHESLASFVETILT